MGWLTSLIRPRPNAARRAPRARPRLLSLEDRTVPSPVVANMAGLGVWRFLDSTGWVQLSIFDADQVDIDPNGNVVGDFGSAGLWRFRNGVWLQISTANANAIATNGNASGANFVVASFLGGGVWRLTDSAGWQQLTSFDANLVDVDRNANVAVNIPTFGVWRFRNSFGWQQMTFLDANALAMDGNSLLVVSIPTRGVQRFSDATNWQVLSNATAVSVDVNTSFTVIASFAGGAGTWVFQTNWTRITPFSANQVSLTDTVFPIANIAGELWRFNAATGMWMLLSNNFITDANAE